MWTNKGCVCIAWHSLTLPANDTAVGDSAANVTRIYDKLNIVYWKSKYNRIKYAPHTSTAPSIQPRAIRNSLVYRWCTTCAKRHSFDQSFRWPNVTSQICVVHMFQWQQMIHCVFRLNLSWSKASISSQIIINNNDNSISAISISWKKKSFPQKLYFPLDSDQITNSGY